MKYDKLKNKKILLTLFIWLLVYFQQYVFAQTSTEHHEQTAQAIDVNFMLLSCAYNGDLQCVKDAIEADADVNVQDTDSLSTALIYALRNEHMDIVYLLLEQENLDPDLEGNDGATALDLAMHKDKHDVVSKLLDKEATSKKDQVSVFYKLKLFSDQHKQLSKKFKDKLKKSHGHCAGLSKVWLYSKWASGNNFKQYNNEWFWEVIELIIRWNGKSNLDKDTSEKMYQFLSMATLFQDPMYHNLKVPGNDFVALLKHSSLSFGHSELNKGYTIASTVNVEQLKEILYTIVKDNKLIVITSLDPRPHDVALYRRGNRYYYYDSNNSSGEIETNLVEEVATEIFKSFSFNKPAEPPIHPAVGIVVYGVNEPNVIKNKGCDTYSGECDLYNSYRYEEQKDILNRLKIQVDGIALISAANIGCLSSARYFLQKNVSVNAVKSDNSTSLMFASGNGDSNMVKELLLAGAEPNLVNSLGINAFMFASLHGFPPITKILFNNGADLNWKDKNGMTAFMFACGYGSVDVIDQLLSIEGVELDVIAKDGIRSAISLAAMNNDANIIEKLVKKNNDIVNLLHNDNKTALMMVSEAGNIDAVVTLIKNGAKINLVSKTRKISALMFSLFSEHPDVAIELLENQADPNLVSSDGITALMIAAYKGYGDVVDELLKKCANSECKNDKGLDAVSYAKIGNHPEIADRISNFVPDKLCLSKY